MTKRIDDLTAKQLDKNGKSKWALFLPAISSFYANYIGRQRHEPNYIDSTRMPNGFERGIEGMNFLNPEQAYFPYKWSLYSAGHADIDVTKPSMKEDMIRNRDPNSFVLGDSGGFQIAKGIWEADWDDPSCPRAQKYRSQVLTWMDTCMDYGMILDIPVWATSDPEICKKTGINNFNEAMVGTDFNNDYFMRNRNGNCKFLNVLQGGNETESLDWYNGNKEAAYNGGMKHWCDPNKHTDPFNGWSMGGAHKRDPIIALNRLIDIRDDYLMEKGRQDWIHFLGTSKLEWALFLTCVQNSIRKHVNSDLTVSFDCASPFLATANGQIYTENVFPNHGKWSYRMQFLVDDKKYATDSRSYRDAVLQDKFCKNFTDSPISERLLVSDICYYKPGDLNKIGKEGHTSWDSFSYALQMGHNCWAHIDAVQEGNRRFESGKRPKALELKGNLTPAAGEPTEYAEIIDEIFKSDSRKTQKTQNLIAELSGVIRDASVGERLIKKHQTILYQITGNIKNRDTRYDDYVIARGYTREEAKDLIAHEDRMKAEKLAEKEAKKLRNITTSNFYDLF